MKYELKYAPLAPAVWDTLGEIKRTGWVMREVANPETVQQHTLALIQLAEDIPDFASYQRTGLREILEIHDWPEAIIGDEVILEHDEAVKQKLKADKHAREATALQSICADIGPAGQDILVLWERYENGQMRRR